MFKTALQTITWGDPQHHLFDHIFAEAAEAEFNGVEIGFRRLGQVEVEEARQLFDRHGLRLSASHIGGNLADIAQAADERMSLDRVLRYLRELKSDFLIYSGLNVAEDTLGSEIAHLGQIADRCSDQGIALLYHNHDWEFRNDRRIWRQLLDANIDTLEFAPDLGWAVKGGDQMRTVLDEVGAKAKVLHFKDFITWDDGQNTCHLGTGVVDFTPAWDWLAEQNGADIWLIAEQDNAPDNDRACALNAQYLSSQIARLAR